MSLPKSKRHSSHRPWWAFLTGIMPRRALLGCCMLGAGTVAAASFEPPINTPVNTPPQCVAVADVNGDGKADVVLANPFDGTVSVLLGKGDGTFADAKKFATGSDADTGAYAVVVADMNGDGKPDIIVANRNDSTVSVLLGDGAGNFAAPLAPIPTGAAPVALAFAKLSPGSKGDIVVANAGGNSVSVLLGDGAGGFLPPAAPIPLGYTPASVAIADVSGDGIPDIVTANGSTVSVLLGAGDGTFGAPTKTDVAGDASAVAAANLTGDLKADVVVNDRSGNTVTVLVSNGDGTFGANPQSFDTDYGPNSVAIADVDGDGIPDIVTANGDFMVSADASRTGPFSNGNSVSVLAGNGGGTFKTKQDFATGVGPVSLAVADMNGDGRLDIVTANDGFGFLIDFLRRPGPDGMSGTVSVLLNGTAELLPRKDFDGGGPAYSIAAADLDGDGITDLVVTNKYDDRVAVLLGNGDGTFQDPPLFSSTKYDGSGYGPEAVAATDNNGDTFDFNGDGIPDIVTENYSWWNGGASLTILLGNGDGTFGQTEATPDNLPIVIPFRTAVNMGAAGVAVADMNGDGRPEILTTLTWGYYPNFSSTVVVLPVDADGNFLDQLPGLGEGQFWGVELHDLAVADVDGDGNLDVVAVGTDSSGGGRQGLAFVLFGDGEKGDLQLGGVYPVGQDPRAVAVADLNADGRPDIVTANMGDSTVTVLLGTGAGTFAPSLNFATGSRPSDVTIADMNGDGSPDIITSNSASNSVSILLGNGHGGFSDPQDYLVGQGPNAVVAGEFNGDGRLDLATANDGSAGVPLGRPKAARLPFQGSGNDNVSVLLSNPPPTITGTVAGQPVNDNASIAPFTGVTIADPDNPPEKLTVVVKLDDAAKGTFTTLNGFVDIGGGVYRFTGTPTECTNAIHGLVFTPTPNRVPAGQTETTTFTITANDGILPVTKDSKTTVVVTSVNDPPVLTDPVTASPSPANIGEPVQFAAPFVDPERGAVTYFWDF
ncbi:MAG: VCBS repeat-containing protein, partial [Planctomycetota bacterium]|nr:VCBS repeat-containing protein [Planctomycetota bacterium]